MTDPNAQRGYGYLQLGSLKGLSIGFASPDPAMTSWDEDDDDQEDDPDDPDLIDEDAAKSLLAEIQELTALAASYGR
jgi:hypothetical protein